MTCPNCGEIEKEGVQIYNHALRKQNIGISPVLPICNTCGGEIIVTHTCDAGKIIVINGTCGSGKTTVAQVLQKRGYLAIDGDCAIQSLRHRKGAKQFAWNELIQEIACEIDILSLYGAKIALSCVVLPEDMKEYVRMFEQRNMEFKFILLRPAYQSAVQRCRTRTSHDSVTPEEWIRHFYDILTVADEKVDVIDNTDQTVCETVDIILKLPYRKG